MHMLRDRGITLRMGCKAETIRREKNQCVIGIEGGREVRSDIMLFAAGRMGATDTLNLEACGLACDHRGRLKVNP